MTGVAGGFCQLCHGKAAPLNRMAPGDMLIYYSPRQEMRAGAPIQAFTAIARINESVPYQVTVKEGFEPMRRDVTYIDAAEAPIRPMLKDLSFVQGLPSWGMAFRRGFFSILLDDFQKIASAMQVTKVELPMNWDF
jgi:hypothetical protein